MHALTAARFIDDQKLREQKVEERTQELMEKSKYLEKACSDLLAKDQARHHRTTPQEQTKIGIYFQY